MADTTTKPSLPSSSAHPLLVASSASPLPPPPPFAPQFSMPPPLPTPSNDPLASPQLTDSILHASASNPPQGLHAAVTRLHGLLNSRDAEINGLIAYTTDLKADNATLKGRVASLVAHVRQDTDSMERAKATGVDISVDFGLGTLRDEGAKVEMYGTDEVNGWGDLAGDGAAKGVSGGPGKNTFFFKDFVGESGVTAPTEMGMEEDADENNKTYVDLSGRKNRSKRYNLRKLERKADSEKKKLEGKGDPEKNKLEGKGDPEKKQKPANAERLALKAERKKRKKLTRDINRAGKKLGMMELKE